MVILLLHTSCNRMRHASPTAGVVGLRSTARCNYAQEIGGSKPVGEAKKKGGEAAERLRPRRRMKKLLWEPFARASDNSPYGANC